jgi:hypothetical protein
MMWLSRKFTALHLFYHSDGSSGSFSITKWIHLKGGDQGLLEFFRKIYSVLRSHPLKGEGLLLLEPQGWENYAKAKKLTPVRAGLYYLGPFLNPKFRNMRQPTKL